MSTHPDGEDSQSTTERSRSSFPHPETGELLDSREDFTRALADLSERMMPFYRIRRALQAAAAERFPPAEQPEPRYRTVTQEKVARCPRCGGRLESQEAPEGAP